MTTDLAAPDVPPLEAPGELPEQRELITLNRILPVVQNFIHADGRYFTHEEREAAQRAIDAQVSQPPREAAGDDSPPTHE